MAKTKEQWDAVTLTSEKPQIMVFQHLVEPGAPTLKVGKAKPSFSATFKLDPADPVLVGEGKSIHRICLAVAKEEFPVLFADALKAAAAGGKATVPAVLKHLVAAGVKMPFMTGEEFNESRRQEGKPAYDWAPGSVLFKAGKPTETADGRPINPPVLGSVESGRGVIFDRNDLAMHKSKFFNGAEAFYVVQFAGFFIDGKRNIKAYINQVFITGKGTPMSGGGAEAFDKFLGNVSDVNPVDDIPL